MTDVEPLQLETEGVDNEEEPGFSFLEKEKEPEPCSMFRLDTTGGSFGVCKCGHPRAAHQKKEVNKAQQMLTNLKKKNKNHLDALEPLNEPGDRPCNKFRLDTTASEFGVCKCGFKRADHETKNNNKAKEALDRLKSSNLDKYKDVLAKNLDADGPCDNYRVDTSASEFGVCYCGYKKEDHIVKEENAAAKLLKQLQEKNKEKKEKEDRLAQGIVEQEVTEANQLPEVNTLSKQEAAAASENANGKKKKKKGKTCVIC